MEDLRCASVGAMRGAYDFVVGGIIVKSLDAEQRKRAAARAAAASSAPTTALALRRAAAQAAAFGAPSAQPPSTRNSSREEPRVVYRIFQCILLNGGVFGTSIVAFYCLLLPCVKFLVGLLFGDHHSSAAHGIWMWLQPLLVYTFQALWVLPLFVLSKVVNCLWFQDIADIAFRYITGGRPAASPGLSRVLADVLFSLMVQTLFLLQALIVSMLPIGMIGEIVYLVHLSLLYSLYSFEYSWFNRGWELHRRLSFIEDNWPYFMGFGMPLAVVTSWPSSYFISGCIFSVLFPLSMLSAYAATPMTGTARFPLKLFSPSIWVSNAIFNRITANCAVKPARPVLTPQKRSVSREHRRHSASPRAPRHRTVPTS
uniref:Putative p53-mediated apoptosis protein n=1 Tax=Amblyomma aureolatum TaxID=187763 RepID=A0A1E1X7L3_9ACAR